MKQKLLEYGIFSSSLLYILWLRWSVDLISKTIFGLGIVNIWMYFEELNAENKAARVYDEFVRKCNGIGLWCSVLFPLALTLSCANSSLPCSDLHQNIALMTWPLTITAYFWIKCKILEESSLPTFLTHMLTLVANSLICYLFKINLDFLTAIICMVLLQLVFWTTANHLLFIAAKSFSVGEVLVFAQGATVFCVATFLNVKTQLFTPKSDGGVLEFCQMSNLGAALFALSLLHIPKFREPRCFFVLAAFLGLGFIIPTASFLIDENALVWLSNYVSRSPIGVVLMIHLVDMVALTAMVIVNQAGKTVSRTIQRKYFHFLFIFTFLPLFVYDIELLFLTTGVMLGIFIILECIRIEKFTQLGDWTHDYFSLFVDEKNGSTLIVDHMTLLLGLSLPIWMYPTYSSVSIAAYSGLLTVGIGDSCASIGGHLYGTRHWPDGKRTYEGTVFSIIGQTLVYLVCLILGLTQFSVWRFIPSIILCSLFESVSSQVDNVVLPFLSFSLLML